jgi:hypothetical protein
MMMQTLFSPLIVFMLISDGGRLSYIETDTTSRHFCDKDVITIMSRASINNDQLAYTLLLDNS